MREELKALGLDDDLVEQVMRIHGEHNQKLASGITTANNERDAAKAELKRYQKGGDSYIDAKEHERLKAFEKDTLTSANRKANGEALMELYRSENVSESAAKLLVKTHNLDEIERDENGKVKGGADIIKADKADYAELFSANGNAGVPHATEGAGTSETNPRKKIY